jgi:hypothetical protein
MGRLEAGKPKSPPRFFFLYEGIEQLVKVQTKRLYADQAGDCAAMGI